MEEKPRLRIIDEVNVKFENLDPMIRRKIVAALKFLVPYARHMPAFKLGRWDGKVAFATVGGATFINLLDRVFPILIEAGIDLETGIDIIDERPSFDPVFPTVDENFVSDRVWPAGHPIAGQPIMLRDYQVDAINNYTANLRSLQSISTGGGKTLTTACLSLLVEPYGRSMVIVPSKTLVEQTEDDYKNMGLDVGVYFGDRKEVGHTHTICTWQSLSAFCKKKDDYGNMTDAFGDFIKGVVCIMVDEAHSAKANVLKDLLCGPFAHVPIRWGMTGTIPKEDYEFLSLLSAIGPVVGEVRAKTLQDKGVLSECKIEMFQLDDSHVEYASYAEEYDFLVSDPTRLTWIANFVAGLEGNTLVLVNRIVTGETLQQMIPDSVFISGRMTNADRRIEFKELNDSENRTICATYGTMSTGVNLPRIHNLVLIHCGKSFTRVIQSAGRVLRKAVGKDVAMIYDICSNLKFDKKHVTERKKMYREAEYPFEIRKIIYRA
jgi:superfamily II DNA or RNA helicase